MHRLTVSPGMVVIIRRGHHAGPDERFSVAYGMRPPFASWVEPKISSALSEYTSALFNALCARLGVVQSMGRVGSALDNAVSESFNSVLKVEFVHRQAFATRAEARVRIATWIADFYNMRRCHSAAGGLAPTEFERVMKEQWSTNDR